MSRLTFPIDVSNLPPDTYVVGGWIRDHLLQRQRAEVDLDFVLSQGSLEVAKSIAGQYQGGFVVLDREREIARVVLPGITLDFAKQMGDSIEADLSRRDFCMNAIAVGVHDPDGMLDPFGGCGDIASKQIRMVAPENLCDDPLRILRAYRQAAQLGFTIEPWTRSTLGKLAPTLQRVAVERVRMELGYLLRIPAGTPWLRAAIEEKILDHWLPIPRLQLDRLMLLDGAMTQLVERLPALTAYFDRELIPGQTIGGTTKYASLVAVATHLDSLCLSRVEQRWITCLLRYLPAFLSARSNTSPLEQYHIFAGAGETLPALLSLGIASGCPLPEVLPWLDRWCDPHDPLAHPATLLTGDDLKQSLGVPPGKHIGQLLAKIREAQICNRLSDRSSALAYAQTLWSTWH